MLLYLVDNESLVTRLMRVMGPCISYVSAAHFPIAGQCPVYPVSVEQDKVTVTTQEGCKM